MIQKDHEDFENSTDCWICKKGYQEDEVRVKDHDRIIWKYRGFGRQDVI